MELVYNAYSNINNDSDIMRTADAVLYVVIFNLVLIFICFDFYMT